ncbi:MAG: formate/nitrite transporter family protein [Eubacterium sp.]|nr:formate/nitrite transporter family protein [Eubacterium sp.]
MKPSKEILAGYQNTAAAKTSLSALKMIISGIFAGFFIALGGLGSQVAATAIGGSAGKLVGACVFPVGLFLVVCVGVELFTGNCLLVIPLFGGKSSGSHPGAAAVLKNWIFVYIGNFIGGLLLAAGVYFSHMETMFDGALGQTMTSAASSKMTLDPVSAIIKATLCNILVCLAVWVAMGAADAMGKFIAVFLPVMLFVLCGFEHSVANMYFIPTGLMLGAEGSVVDFLLRNLLPVTIGNIIGGALIVGGGISYLYRN